MLRVPLGFKSEMYILSLLGNPNLCSPTLKPLHPCSKPKQPLSHVVLVMLVVWVVILLKLQNQISSIWYQIQKEMEGNRIPLNGIKCGRHFCISKKRKLDWMVGYIR